MPAPSSIPRNPVVPQNSDRTRLIRLIHVARRDLAMEDDAYRALVSDLCNGKTSSADCTAQELERVIGHLKKAGFKVRKPATAKPAERRPLATDPESTKLRAVWLVLHQAGGTESASEAALAAYVRRMTGVDAMQFVQPRDRFMLIEGLKAWAARTLYAAIPIRIAQLQAAGKVAPGTTATHIHNVVGPTLNPKRYDALYRVWQWLDGREQGNPNAVKIEAV